MGCFVLGQAYNSEKDRDTETQYLTAKVLPYYEFMLVLNINDIMVLISLSIIIILLLLLLIFIRGQSLAEHKLSFHMV